MTDVWDIYGWSHYITSAQFPNQYRHISMHTYVSIFYICLVSQLRCILMSTNQKMFLKSREGWFTEFFISKYILKAKVGAPVGLHFSIECQCQSYRLQWNVYYVYIITITYQIHKQVHWNLSDKHRSLEIHKSHCFGRLGSKPLEI